MAVASHLVSKKRKSESASELLRASAFSFSDIEDWQQRLKIKYRHISTDQTTETEH